MQVKPSGDFHAFHRKVDGLMPECKICRQKTKQRRRELKRNQGAQSELPLQGHFLRQHAAAQSQSAWRAPGMTPASGSVDCVDYIHNQKLASPCNRTTNHDIDIS
jgi:hypothetical protein